MFTMIYKAIYFICSLVISAILFLCTVVILFMVGFSNHFIRDGGGFVIIIFTFILLLCFNAYFWFYLKKQK
jgi:hypothetical protein